MYWFPFTELRFRVGHVRQLGRRNLSRRRRREFLAEAYLLPARFSPESRIIHSPANGRSSIIPAEKLPADPSDAFRPERRGSRAQTPPESRFTVRNPAQSCERFSESTFGGKKILTPRFPTERIAENGFAIAIGTFAIRRISTSRRTQSRSARDHRKAHPDRLSRRERHVMETLRFLGLH